MPRSPFEGFNVFDYTSQNSLQQKLRERSLSDNLVEIRTPFIRYTTSVEFPTSKWHAELEKYTQSEGGIAGIAEAYEYLNPLNLGRYAGGKYFTLGVHGWDNSMSNDDMYGTQANNGLIVGTTYKDGQQILVRTNEQSEVPVDFNQPNMKTLGDKFASPISYPPPGIESATVERLRNGNVLKFTVNAVCYTRQQLDMLDMLAFSPGMTCILEWGNTISNPAGTYNGLQKDKVLNFRNTESITDELLFLLELTVGGITLPEKQARLQNGNTVLGSRSYVIEKWCKPNNYNYDFAVATVGNVKTELIDNKYKVTLTCYGVADNIMYISAYATNNPQSDKQTNGNDLTYVTSVREYFSPRSKFSVLLSDMVEKDPEIVKFEESDNQSKKAGVGAAESSGTPINDLGQENTYYITLNKFINFFLNDTTNGILKIINDSVTITGNRGSAGKIKQLLSQLKDPVDGIPIKVGYNEVLRSTDPSVMLIYNWNAMKSNTLSPQVAANYQSFLGVKPSDATVPSQALARLAASKLTQIDEQGNEKTDGNPSGIATTTSGIWLNSKFIQEVFLSSRTIFEAIEAMLLKINAATEGYWDLKLIYDEENDVFRIYDDNLKELPTKDSQIYVFNKKLPAKTQPSQVIGPEVLSVKINTDYSKLVFSQLAISGLNSSTGLADTRDLKFARNPLSGPRLFDLLKKENPIESKGNTPETKLPSDISNVDEFVKSALKDSLYNDIRPSITEQLKSIQFSKLPPTTRQTLSAILSSKQCLTETAAKNYAASINSDKLTISQINGIKFILQERAIAIIKAEKRKERAAFELGGADIRLVPGENAANAVNNVLKNIDKSASDLINTIKQKANATENKPPQVNPWIQRRQGI